MSRECRGNVEGMSRECRGSVEGVSRECQGNVEECRGSVQDKLQAHAIKKTPLRGSHGGGGRV